MRAILRRVDRAPAFFVALGGGGGNVSCIFAKGLLPK
jgi:hypothetical protein